MIDREKWSRLLFHVLTELETESDGDPVAIERAAVLRYTEIHQRLNNPED